MKNKEFKSSYDYMKRKLKKRLKKVQKALKKKKIGKDCELMLLGQEMAYKIALRDIEQ